MREKIADGRADPGGEQPSEVEGRKQRWPRRRVLRWALGLVAGGGGAALTWLGRRKQHVEEEEAGAEDGGEVDGGRAKGGPAKEAMSDEAWAAQLTQQAAWYCFAGNPNASPRLDWAIRTAPSYSPARLMSACWSMQTGRWDLVPEDLAVPTVRDTPEARLLLELAERRHRGSDWRHAFFEAWTSLGRPDFRKSPLLPEPLEWNHFISESVTRSVPEAWRFPRMVLQPALMERQQPWVLEQVRASQSVPLLMALREHLQALEPQAPLRQFLSSEVEARLGHLAGDASGTLQLALVSFLGGSSPQAPFARRELEALEKLTALPEWKQPSSEQFFLEMRPHLDMLYAPDHHAWALATLAQGSSLGSCLLQRARASKALLSEDEQRWMGRLLWIVGARLREQHSGLELDMGLRLQMFGSELMQNIPAREECIALWGELGRWEEALKQAAYYRWPLAALQEESCEPRARNEHVWMQAFAGKGQLP